MNLLDKSEKVQSTKGEEAATEIILCRYKNPYNMKTTLKKSTMVLTWPHSFLSWVISCTAGKLPM